MVIFIIGFILGFIVGFISGSAFIFNRIGKELENLKNALSKIDEEVRNGGDQ